MAQGHITYLELPQEVRRHAADRTRKQIRDLMTTNFITPDQMTFLNYRLQQIDAWERGTLLKR